ncbi:unnamed protein product, partial [Dicrocoelium dendriticum]
CNPPVGSHRCLPADYSVEQTNNICLIRKRSEVIVHIVLPARRCLTKSGAGFRA